MTTGSSETDSGRWYDGVTRYQWLVLLIASLGWVFDVFEGQIFVASMNEAMPSLVPAGTSRGDIAMFNNIALGAFLIGGALGGIVFGMLSDRIGRKRTMSLTIIVYSLFTCLSAFSQQWWHLAVFRFLVALGVGGEWAVASSLVAEVFPQKARARAGGIFHASSVLGTYLAVAAGYLIVGNAALQSAANPSLPWRIGFAVGALPAVLIIWIRRSLREPDSWHEARARAQTDSTQQMGRVSHLFGPALRGRTFVGVTLAAVGLATFWGVHIYGKNILLRDTKPYYLPTATQLEDVSAAVRAEHLGKLGDAVLSELQHEGVTPSVMDSVIQSGFLQVDMTRRQLTIVPNGESTSASAARVTLLAHDATLDPATVLAEAPHGNPSATILFTGSPDEADVFQLAATSLLNRLNQRLKFWEMLGMLLVTTGGGIGLLAFGPICERIGRRGAFLAFHLGGLIVALLLFQVLAGQLTLLIVLPIFGFLTLGMHAGYAIYFPELYPTRLRSTGTGFCFNAGRILAAPILFISGWMQKDWGYSMENAASILSLLFALVAVILIFAPETRGQELPE